MDISFRNLSKEIPSIVKIEKCLKIDSHESQIERYNPVFTMSFKGV